MSWNFPLPRRGDKLSASRSAHALRMIASNRLLPSPGVGVSRGPGGTTLRIEQPIQPRPSARPEPFEVRYDYSLSDGAGGWKIYLPTDHLLSYGGVYVETGEFVGVSALEDANGDPTGWYALDNVDLDAAAVWMTVTPPTSADVSAGVVFGDGSDQGGGGETSGGDASDIKVCIANVSYTPATDSAAASIVIRQSVVGAISLSDSALTPDDKSTELAPQDATSGADNTDAGKLQVKGWHDGTPVAPSSLADTLSGGSAALGGHLVLRTTSGVLQYVPIGRLDSALTPDDKSTELVPRDATPGADNADAGKLQVKGWRKGTPIATSSLADTLSGGSAALGGHLVLRTTSGALQYVPIGAMSGLADISALNGVTLVTDVEWVGSPDYAIRVTKHTATVANNVLSLGPAVVTDIETTPLSGEY